MEVSSIDEGLGCVTEEVSVHHRHEGEAEDAFLRAACATHGPPGPELAVPAGRPPALCPYHQPHPGTAHERASSVALRRGPLLAHCGPGPIGCPALPSTALWNRPAGWGQQVHAHGGGTCTFPKQSLTLGPPRRLPHSPAPTAVPASDPVAPHCLGPPCSRQCQEAKAPTR